MNVNNMRNGCTLSTHVNAGGRADLLLHFGLVVSITFPDVIMNLLTCQVVSTRTVSGPTDLISKLRIWTNTLHCSENTLKTANPTISEAETSKIIRFRKHLHHFPLLFYVSLTSVLVVSVRSSIKKAIFIKTIDFLAAQALGLTKMQETLQN